jgi:quinol monooxygenase YgiN
MSDHDPMRFLLQSYVILTGFMVCRTLDEADRVAGMLPDHIRLTRAEPGCLAFEVIRSMADPVRFAVREIFASQADFADHRSRVAQSAWGRSTRGIPRDYMLTDGQGQRRFPVGGADTD